MKIIIDVDHERQVRLSPHRFGQVGNLFIFETPDGERLDLHLDDHQMRTMIEAGIRRLGWRIEEEEAAA